MNGFERRKEQKKESIITASLELFALYGFKKVSINDVATKADVSPVTIYNHFGSKDGLIKEAIITQFNEMMDTYHDIIHGPGTFAEKLESIVFDKIGIASQFQGELVKTMFKEDGEYQEFINTTLMEQAAHMSLELFDFGKKEGYISCDISDETILVFLEVLRTGIAGSTRLHMAKDDYPRLVRELNQLFLYGLIDTGDRKEFAEKEQA